MIHFTADTHFFHRNIIDFCKRPWYSVDEMNEGLIERWNSRIKPTDQVYHLGDVIFGGSEKMMQVLPRLNGIKYLVPGNHDNEKQLAKHFEHILPPIFNLKWEGHRFVLCHFPLLSWENRQHGWYHLHGHTHGAIRNYPRDTGDYHGNSFRILDVGCDCHDWAPISIEEVIEKLG